MSDQTPEAVEIPRSGDAAFAALMDVLAPEEDGAPAGEGGATAGAAAGDAQGAGGAGGAAAAPAAGGQPAGAGAGAVAVAPGDAGAGADAKPVPTAGEPQPGVGEAKPADGGGAVLPGAGDGGGGGDRPAAWTATAADLAPRIESLSTGFEERVNQAYQQQALAEVRTEYANYFTAIEQHPRALIGTEVPSINKEGTEILQDAEDAREWQDAVKHLLVSDVKDRASRAMDDQADFIDTIHSSIDLFRNNKDLIPGTRDFDVDLANRFATMAKPYELRVDGKLHGYSIPVQPLIDQLRAQAAAKPAAAVASTPAAAAAPPAAPPASPPEQPQAGISSKAGSGTETEDFSTLFGTIGLPNLQI